MMKFSSEMLTGKCRDHLQPLPCPFSMNHFLQADALKAFRALQKSAVENSFDLQPASSFRDFQRQQLIWNAKFIGERKVHDDQGMALNLTALSDWEKAQAILRWSAMPGASRHHWGTEVDIFDPGLLPQGQSLQLEPWEYAQGGDFYELSQWLQENLCRFDFTLPFVNLTENKQIGCEPWHISYLPIAELAREQFTPEVLLSAWENEDVMGKNILTRHLPEIFQRFWL